MALGEDADAWDNRTAMETAMAMVMARQAMRLSSGTSKDGSGDFSYPRKLSAPAGPVWATMGLSIV